MRVSRGYKRRDRWRLQGAGTASRRKHLRRDGAAFGCHAPEYVAPYLTSDFTWLDPQRYDLYLAARIFAGGERDGDCIQWAANTVLIHIELYDDPLQGRESWLFDDELAPANAFGEALWAVLEADPYDAPELLSSSPAAEAVRLTAATLVAAIERNGRGVPNSLEIELARAAAAERPSGGVQGWWANVLPVLFK